jgi:acyl-CoA reductase-like NAD-dependent aldehyde dehydrogenase
MAGSFEAIRAAVIEGRAQSPRYIQRQLVSLHDALVKAQSDIRRAIRRETNYTTGEVDAEIYLALKVLKQEFNAFDFPSVLEAEYSIAHLKDHPSRRVALGCAYIIPSEHNRFYSIVQPTAAAIAAGNCVMIEVAPIPSFAD